MPYYFSQIQIIKLQIKYTLNVYIMIYNYDIQKMLQNAKLTSITDIITFVINHVSQQTIKPLEMLEDRICELERPKGMDRVMLQEVKTLIDAMIDQRQEQLRRELERKYRENAHNSFQVDNSRRSLNQIDFINIMNMQNGTQSQQLKKTTPNITSRHHINKNDIIMTQIRQLRQQLQAKPQRRQFQDLKSSLNTISKDLVTKINFQQTQKLILKFQKDIFLKISQNKAYTDELESKIMRSMQNEVDLVRKQWIEAVKMKSLSKIEKKMKKYGQQLCVLQQNVNTYSLNVMQYKSECVKYHKNSLQDIQNMQGLIEQMNQQRQAQLLKESKFNNNNTHTFNTALWIAAPPTYKNSYVAWQREIFNNDKKNIQFQSGKTNIRLVNAGFYEISCAVYGGSGNMKKGPLIVCNSEQIGRLQMRVSNCQSLPRWYFKQLVYIRQNRSTLSVRFQNQQNSSCILFWLNKFSY